VKRARVIGDLMVLDARKISTKDEEDVIRTLLLDLRLSFAYSGRHEEGMNAPANQAST
jgi:hypothetical protein